MDIICLDFNVSRLLNRKTFWQLIFKKVKNIKEENVHIKRKKISYSIEELNNLKLDKIIRN
uniref:Uncharacterized protein n=1 Tax=Octopus bimaculoides TaxID=37653 RepID=A0A0L8FZY4_OCTBM